MKAGELVYLPSGITLIDDITVKNWITTEEPTLGIIISPDYNDDGIYRLVHALGSSWLTRQIDTMTMEVPRIVDND